jgi:hypothetical protein
VSETALFARVVAELIGTGAEDFSRVDFATRLAHGCAALSVHGEVGVVFVGQGGDPTVAGGSTTRVHELEALGLILGEGSAVDALEAGVASVNAGFQCERWRSWGPAARRLGYDTVHSFVLGAGVAPIGVLEVFGSSGASEPEVELVQPLADLVAMHLERQSALREACARADQLENALRSRSVIEQAKGMLAHKYGRSDGLRVRVSSPARP